MKESKYVFDFNEEEESFEIKELISKYFRYWPWFLLTVLLCAGVGFLYMQYAPVIYRSEAKIKIIDETKEMDVVPDVLSGMLGPSGINLDNEVEVLRSYRLLQQVVAELRLDVAIYESGLLRGKQAWDPPFMVTKDLPEESLEAPLNYTVAIQNSKFVITDEQEKTLVLELYPSDSLETSLPFRINLRDGVAPEAYRNLRYEVVLVPLKDAVMNLAESLEIAATNKESDILSLVLKGENTDRSEAILNTLIAKFNQDGILDRQLVARRTLEVIDKRFTDLATELDSIEVGKKEFKQSNQLSYIEADAGLTLQRKAETEDEVAALENQISLSKLLKETVINQAEYSLLPADIGLENSSLNNLVETYNELALEREKLLPTVGVNHPQLRTLSEQLEKGKVNIIKSVNIYQAQLRTSLGQLNREKGLAGAIFSELPEQEKMLRSIERQQSIKEKLFLLLLEKREEAAISLATTTPSVKVVDYGITDSKPISPKMTIVYPVSLMLGLFLPFLVLYIRFSLDTKVYDRKDYEKYSSEIPFLGEIPFFKDMKPIVGIHDRSILAESFRMLSTNVNYLLPKAGKAEGKVIYVTSAIKGEGKTFTAYNLAMAYASIKKNVLLVGADLRNSQLHQYLDILKNAKGIADYLADPSLGWEDVINQGLSHKMAIKVCYSRNQPPNAPELLSGERFKGFIDAVRQNYDYIIVDTAPTLLVSDTFLISPYADLTLFVSRAGVTEKRLIDYSHNLSKSQKLKNMAFVLNGVGKGKRKGYNYGYGYGYGEK